MIRHTLAALTALALTGCAGAPLTLDQLYFEGAAERNRYQEPRSDAATHCAPDVRFEAGITRPVAGGRWRAAYELYAQHTSTPCGDSGINGLGVRLRAYPWAKP